MKKSINKILVAHSSNDNYGASKILILVLELLIKKGYQVHLLLPSNGPLNENKIVKKTTVKIIKMGIFRRKYLNFFGLINRVFFIIKSSLYLRNYIRKNNIDFVYVNTSTLISPVIASKITRKNNLIHVHEIPAKSKIYSKFLVIFFNLFCDKFICVSKSVTEFWLKKGIIKNKLKTITNGFIFINPKSKSLNDQKIIFTSISRIIPYKGHIFLIDLFHKLCKENNKIYLQIIGDTLPQYKNYIEKLKLMVKSIGLEDKIKFLGFKNDIKFILNNSNFFIHTPILPDPFPTAIFEAIESKTPVITNNLGGGIEILNNGINGLIIENKSVLNSCNKILDFIDNKTLQKENVNNAFDYVCENFSLEKFENKILNNIG